MLKINSKLASPKEPLFFELVKTFSKFCSWSVKPTTCLLVASNFSNLLVTSCTILAVSVVCLCIIPAVAADCFCKKSKFFSKLPFISSLIFSISSCTCFNLSSWPVSLPVFLKITKITATKPKTTKIIKTIWNMLGIFVLKIIIFNHLSGLNTSVISPWPRFRPGRVRRKIFDLQPCSISRLRFPLKFSHYFPRFQ